MLLTAALLLAALVSAAPCPGFAVVETTCNVPGQVALTFDDGPWKYETAIAAQLSGGKATFFLNGRNWGCIYDRVSELRELHSQGHTLGSHTWSHKDLTTLEYGEIDAELEQLETAFIRIRVKPLYFRPPYGAINSLVLQVLSDRGYRKVVLWDSDTRDTSGATVAESEAVVQRVIDDFPNPHLVLQHSIMYDTPTYIVPWSVPRLQARGYQLVTVDACLGDGVSPYKVVGPPGVPDASWHC